MVTPVTAADPRHHHHRDHVGAGRLQRQGGLRLSQAAAAGRIDRTVPRAMPPARM
jgi:hypothetical protein